jgi:hypothetical protein
MDDLRPRGTVEVRCEYPGCCWSFWLDCLDPRLSTGPFDCGADHRKQERVNAALDRLANAGLVYQTLSGPGVGTGPQPEGAPAIGYLVLRLREPGFDGSQEAWTAGQFTWVTWHSIEELETLPCDPNQYPWMPLDEVHRNRPEGYTGP